MRRYVIVANQTLPSPVLRDAVSERIGSGEVAFHVVVPITPIDHGFTWDEEESRRQATERLDRFLVRLRELGVDASGEIGDRDPVQAVRDAIRGLVADEIILSTLPPGISRWLGQDVPGRLRDSVALPVSVIYDRSAVAADKR